MSPDQSRSVNGAMFGSQAQLLLFFFLFLLQNDCQNPNHIVFFSIFQVSCIQFSVRDPWSEIMR